MRKYMRMKDAGVKERYAVGAGECRQLVHRFRDADRRVAMREDSVFPHDV
jgi:hypothetical protein